MSTVSSIKPASASLDEELTRRALDLSLQGKGLVSPNPMVGCVITTQDGRVVGEGFYTYEGVEHAESLALREAANHARGGTAYVSLEPHSHFGRTPPCTQLLIDAGIKRVVCPIEDPNPLVSGKGFAALNTAGIETVVGICAAEANRVNEHFICWHNRKRPFVHLKLAMSLDGRISLNRSVSTALSGTAAREYVQALRHENDAILVGSNTAVVDDPQLTDRSGKARRRALVRVILDDRLRVDPQSSLVKTAREIPTAVITSSQDASKAKQLGDAGVDVINVPETCRNVSAVLDALRERDVQSVLVEGGSTVAGAFVDARLVDKVTFLIAPIVLGGSDAPMAIGGHGASDLASAMRLENITVEKFGDDIAITGYPDF